MALPNDDFEVINDDDGDEPTTQRSHNFTGDPGAIIEGAANGAEGIANVAGGMADATGQIVGGLAEGCGSGCAEGCGGCSLVALIVLVISAGSALAAMGWK